MIHPEKDLSDLFDEATILDADKPHIRAYYGPPESQQQSPTPDWIIRPASFHKTYTPDQHAQHIELLREQGIHVPEISIEADVASQSGRHGFIAAQYIQGTAATGSYPLTSEQLYQYEAVFDGLSSYHAAAKKLGGFVLHDIFSLTQFMYGTLKSDPDSQSNLWLVDIEPIVTPVNSHFSPPPAKSMKDTLRLINQHLIQRAL